MTEARGVGEDKLSVLAHLDMLMVDRLRAWAHNIDTYGANISQWGDPAFVGAEMNRIAADIEAAVKIGGQMGDELATLRAEHDRLKASQQELAAELMAALNEPMYTGSRRDWMDRAYREEQENDRLRADYESLRASFTDRLVAAQEAAKSVQALRQALEKLIETNAGEVSTHYGLFVYVELSAYKACEAALALPGEAAQETQK